MNEYIKKYKQDFEKVIDFFKKELSKIRTGRANPALLEDILVEVYGTPTPIKQLATISLPEVRSLLIEPWDKNIIKDIEAAISKEDLDISVSSDSQSVRITFPQLTEESREKLKKVINEQLEDTKVSLRQVRDKVKEEIEKDYKESKISEDERYELREDLDKHIEELNKQIEELAESKRQEIMKI